MHFLPLPSPIFSYILFDYTTFNFGNDTLFIIKPLSLLQSKPLKKTILALSCTEDIYIYKACIKVFFISKPELKLDICEEKEVCDACRSQDPLRVHVIHDL
jgi:hypothetical protein